MSGEALTTGRSATIELTLQVVDINHEGVDLLASEGEEEIRAVEAGDARGFLLRDLAALVPVDRGGQPEIPQELLRDRRRAASRSLGTSRIIVAMGEA